VKEGELEREGVRLGLKHIFGGEGKTKGAETSN